MMELGAVFPPRDEWDIAGYDTDDCVAGYREHRLDEPLPGANRTPAYRWGWANARRDRTRIDDGCDAVRSAYIRMSGRPN